MLHDTHFPIATAISRPTSFTGAHIADIAKRFTGIHGERYGRHTIETEGLDTVGLIELVAQQIGDSVSIDRDWASHGGDIRMAEISLEHATIGDVLAFDFTQAPRGRSFGHQLAILTYGRNAMAKDAQIVCVRHGVGINWLDGFWRDRLVRAYRFAAKREA